MIFELKPLTQEAIPKALEKAERYRLLKEPAQAESICLAGIIAERRAGARLQHGGRGSEFVTYEWLREAMTWYEKAEAIRPAGNDDALLRWNTCARILTRNPHLQRGPEDHSEPPLE